MNNAQVTTVYFVRHGDVHNPNHVFYGALPLSLSANGRSQVADLLPFFKDKGISAIYASPIQRTQETAGILAHSLNLSVITDMRLTESEMFVAWEGLPIKDLAHEHLEQWQIFKTKPSLLKLNGSTLDDLANRMNIFLEDVLHRYKGESIVAVSHGDPIKTLFCKINDRPFDDIRKISLNYAGVVSITADDKSIHAEIVLSGEGDFSG